TKYEEDSLLWDEYQKRESMILAQLYATIPDSLLIKIKNLPTAQAWAELCNEFESQSDLYKIDIRCKMMELCCAEGGDVRAHIDTLIAFQDQLSGLGSPLPDSDYAAVIMGSLPRSFDPTIATITAAARINQQPLTPLIVIWHALDKYDRRKLHT
ncbi:hypothetical protein DENSPDRAFT_752352, partial [Dentipellis sp. KUC8613]